MNNPNWINGEGSSTAKLMLVLDYPSRSDDDKHWTGQGGQLVTEMLQKAGVSRSEIFITYVCKICPPAKDIGRLSELGKSIADFEPILWNEINAIQPNAILALGELSLKTLTGKQGITKYRGSILQSIQGFPKVIPTIHPAALLEHSGEAVFKWSSRLYIQADFKRVVEESNFKDFSSIPQRNLWVCRDVMSFMKFVERNRSASHLAIDIETFKSTPLCIGLSFEPSEAISIPLQDLLSEENPNGIGMNELSHIWEILIEVLQNEKTKKIGHNFKFDETILRTFHFNIQNFYSDTMLKFHTLYPEIPKSLEFITSLFTYEPYYKSEYREYNPKKDDFSRILLYNAKDAAITREIDKVLEEELQESELYRYFYEHVIKLHYFYTKLESYGIQLHEETYKNVIQKYKDKLKCEDEQLVNLIAHPINLDSSPQVCNLLYNELKMPKRTRRRAKGHSSLSADEKAITSLLLNAVKNEIHKEILRGILKHRSNQKTLGTYLGVPKNEKSKVHYADKDGRVRTSYLISGTESGRTSTNKLEPPVRPGQWGLAFQTITKHSQEGSDIRSMFVPKEGYCFVEADQSQAESRIALVLAKEYEQLALMDKLDIHVLRASWITGNTYEQEYKIYKDGNDYYRQIGKHSGHANDNGVGKNRLAELISHHSDGKIEISAWKAGKILEVINRNVPGIEENFHKGIQEVLENNNRTLVNPFGRRRIFYEKWGDDLFKEAYADIKQSIVAYISQSAGLQLNQVASWIRVLFENHDALLMELPIWKLDESVPIIRSAFERPIDFNIGSLRRDFKLIIPCEIKYSFTNWGDMLKYKGEVFNDHNREAVNSI